MELIVNMDDMEMADLLDELTYRLLANAASRAQARDRAAIIGYWAEQQSTRLSAGRGLRVDHASVVAEALVPAEEHNAAPAGQDAA
jgi:hypothetical protein